MRVLGPIILYVPVIIQAPILLSGSGAGIADKTLESLGFGESRV